MKDYLKNWIPRIQNFSLKLDKLSKLYNQPWVLVNDLNDFIKIIFQEKGKLLVSKNGVVSNGSWELIAISNLILLDISGEKRLYNHQFIDNGLMVLKLDGKSTDLFILANQNIIPDFDIKSYLVTKYPKLIYQDNKTADTQYSKPISQNNKTIAENIYETKLKLSDGRILQIVKYLGDLGATEVKINHKEVPDGFYRIANSDMVCEVQNSKIIMEYYIKGFKQENGQVIEVGGNRISGIVGEGSPVWLNGNEAPDGRYKKGLFSTIEVINGRIK